tara:strand:+ start:31584 stop:32147 length:564 start_codon:yes stop_codon:yes gene_type:complete
MNALIYCEFGNLFIRKPNGLEWRHDSVDAPDLGFEFEVLIYDDIECKVEKWEDGKELDEQEKSPLSETEKDAIEAYIENAEPPSGVSLNQQYVGRIADIVRNNSAQQCERYGFDDMIEVLMAAREGSAHPHRSNARRALEYTDAVANVAEGVMREISITREDTLKPLEEYILQIPPPTNIHESDGSQ